MYQAAKQLRRDPLLSLGVGDDPRAPLTPEQALFVLRMENPKLAREQDDEAFVSATSARYQREEAWHDAVHGAGYQGERGKATWPTRR